jgi:hypothetical protein
MVAGKNIRLVDALELPEIRKALDDQMQPDRKEGPDLQAALEQAAALREELTARIRDVRTLAEEVTQLKELLLRRQREFDNFRRRGATGNAGAAPPARVPVMGIGGLAVVALILLMASVAGAFHALRHSEPAQVANTARQTDTREFRQIPASVHHPGTLPLLECPEGVKGSSCDAYAADWIASRLASQAPAKKTRQRKPKVISPDEELLERIRTPDDATLRAFVTPVVRGNVAPVVKGNLEQELGEERAPQVSQPENP